VEFPVSEPDGLNPPLTLRTARLLLRPLREADRDQFVQLWRNSESFFAPWMPKRPADTTLEMNFARWLESTEEGIESGTQFRFAALFGGTLVGFFHLFQVERGVFQCATASWMISVDYAQKGLGTEGLAAMLDFAFGPPMRGLALHRVQANIIPTNTASIRLAEKTGFRREGLAKRYLEIAGRWQDHFMYAKLADEH
jgi:ribosomal-protein-alanine N-acetyltransferase